MLKMACLRLSFFFFLSILGHATPSLAAASYQAAEFDHSAYAHTKYFVIKPVGKGPLRKALRHMRYSLKADVAKAINRAIGEGNDVVLLFSALGSRGFQAAATVSHRIDVRASAKRAFVELEWSSGYHFLSFMSTEIQSLSNNSARVTQMNDGEQLDCMSGFSIAGLLAAQSCDECRRVSLTDDELSSPSLPDIRDQERRSTLSKCSLCEDDTKCPKRGETGVQYFPCKDVLCHACIEAIDRDFPKSQFKVNCPRCRWMLISSSFYE